MIDEACCTCATVILPQYDEKTEKPTLQVHRLECCGRVVCGDCIAVCFLESILYQTTQLILCWRKILDLHLTVSLPSARRSAVIEYSTSMQGPFCQYVSKEHIDPSANPNLSLENVLELATIGNDILRLDIPSKIYLADCGVAI